MTHSDAQAAMIAELQRVLRDEGTVSAEAFFAMVGPLDDAQLGALTRWLRTLPTGLGEQRLVEALHAWLGPHLPGAGEDA